MRKQVVRPEEDLEILFAAIRGLVELTKDRLPWLLRDWFDEEWDRFRAQCARDWATLALPDGFIWESHLASMFSLIARGLLARVTKRADLPNYEAAFQEIAGLLTVAGKPFVTSPERLGMLLQAEILEARAKAKDLVRRLETPWLFADESEQDDIETPSPIGQAHDASVPKNEAAQVRPQATRRGYRLEMRAYMEKKELSTLPEAARALSVGVDTLKSIMSSQGKRRCSDETLQGVLRKIGCSGT